MRCYRYKKHIKNALEINYTWISKAMRIYTGIYSWGFNDEVCPPTSMYAAYNVITAPKSLYLSVETGHWTYPEQTEKLSSWLREQLQKR